MVIVNKKKRVSKKKKISWRKHVDIKDVDKFLEDKRLEERLGKPFEEREDDELFQIDTNPIAKNDKNIKPNRKISYEPKCFNMLKSHSEVPIPIGKRNHVKPPGTKSHPLAVKKRLIKEIKKRNVKLMNKKKNKVQNTDFEVKEDIWNVEDVHKVEKDVWIEKDTVRHTLTNISKLKKHTPPSLQIKPTIIPAIEHPYGGMSYNPSLKDHQELLQVIANKEQTLIKKDVHLNRVTTKMFHRISLEKKEAATFAELSEGLPIGKKNNNKKNISDNLSVNDNDDEFKAVNAPVINKKKDVKQRRKQKEQKILERQRKLVKLEKKKVSDILNINTLNQDIAFKDKKCEQLKEKRIIKTKYLQLEPKRLASTKYENPGLEFNMGEDIAGNLRNIKPEGSLLLDRFKSLQKRNILEPTRIRMKKKTKVKTFVKSDHKINL